ncbi:MAG: GNAT family N-acetyltransferase [Anaerolineaceae bacterium]
MTKRIIQVDIRPWSSDDLPLLTQLLGVPGMTEHIGGPETAEQLQSRHQRYCRSIETGVDPMFVIVVGAHRVPAGSIGYWKRDWQGQQVWETGWSILPKYQGKGIATQATLLIVERVRTEHTHRYLHAYPSVENIPSNAICRKTGFSLLGEVDFEYPKDHWMLCNDWRMDLFMDKIEIGK